MKRNHYCSPEVKDFDIRLSNDLLAFSNGAPEVRLAEDAEDNTFA